MLSPRLHKKWLTCSADRERDFGHDNSAQLALWPCIAAARLGTHTNTCHILCLSCIAQVEPSCIALQALSQARSRQQPPTQRGNMHQTPGRATSGTLPAQLWHVWSWMFQSCCWAALQPPTRKHVLSRTRGRPSKGRCTMPGWRAPCGAPTTPLPAFRGRPACQLGGTACGPQCPRCRLEHLPGRLCWRWRPSTAQPSSVARLW